MNPRNEPNADFKASEPFLFANSISARKAPRTEKMIIPHGGITKIPNTIPMNVPHSAAFEPPVTRVR